MKKHLLKLTVLAVVFFSAATLQAQEYEEYTKPGVYTIGAAGTPYLMTLDAATGGLIWAERLTGDDAAFQEWSIQDHIAPASAGYVQITADITGLGKVRLGTTAELIVTDAEDITRATITVLSGDPVSDTEAADYGLDQFQRRKTGTNRGGNDALFVKPSGFAGNMNFGVAPTATGEPVVFEPGGIDKIEYKFIKDLPVVASVNTFGSDAFLISNPVNNQLTIKGATSKIEQLSLYSVLGSKVVTKTVSNSNGNINLNVSSLSKGLYILELSGSNGEKFTKKIIKQ